MVKIGCNLQIWKSKLDEETISLFSKVKDMGFDGVELPMAHVMMISQKIIDETRNELEKLNLGCTICGGLGKGENLVDDNELIRKNGIKILKKFIDIAYDLGSNLVIGPLYGTFAMADIGRAKTQEEWDRAVVYLREIADYAINKQVTLGLECINRYESYFLNTANEGLSLIRDIGKDNVKIHLDTYHMNIEEKNFYDPIINVGSSLCLLHCSENDRGIPGSGHVNWNEIFQALSDINYKGWLVIESFFEPMKDVPVASSVWRKLAASRDEIPREGVKFLRNKVKEYNLN
jgi:D-psicose/D-tagatose/L-ribulose 3-epimerase